jgi:hypothetical protein
MGYLVSVVIFIVGQLLSFAGPHYSTLPAGINHFRSNRPVSRIIQTAILSAKEISPGFFRRNLPRNPSKILPKEK